MWERKKEYVLHHGKLTLHGNHNIPLWCKLCHNMLDLDVTIAHVEAEQEDLTPPKVSSMKTGNKSFGSETNKTLEELTPPTGDTQEDSDLSQTEDE